MMVAEMIVIINIDIYIYFLKLLSTSKINNSHLISGPPPLTKCKLDDSKCMKASAQAFVVPFTKGNPEWGIEPLEPFFMKSLDASSQNLKLILTDMTGTGLDKCLIRKMQ